MRMENSIFTKIIKGEIPAHKIYEDEFTLAFLDIHPAQPGHTLVVPKQQTDHIWDLPDETYQAVMATCKKIARQQRGVLQVRRVGVRIEGFDVPHAHVHLIPVNSGADFKTYGDHSMEADHAALAAMADRLRL